MKRVKRVCEIYDRESKKGYSNEFIFEKHIKDQFDICRSTFYGWLKTDYEAELAELEKAMPDRKK